MAWTFYGFIEPTNKAHGPLPRKRWIASPADPKRHKFTYRYRAPTGLGPRSSDSDMDRKAVQYARWLAARDGIALPDGRAVPQWALAYPVGQKPERRPHAVRFFGDGHKTHIDVALPNWDWSPAPYTEEHDVTDCPSIAPALALAPIAPAFAPEAPIARPAPGTPEWLAAKASGPRWRYDDARGVGHEGFMERFSDHGGTDVTYWMRDGATGELSLVSGLRAKAMNRIWKAA